MREAEDFIQDVHAHHRAALLWRVRQWTAGDAQLAEDVVQETLVRAWTRRRSLTCLPEELRPWLYTVARNLVIDAHRRRSVRPYESLGDGDEEPVAACHAEAVADRVAVVSAMRRLSVAHRCVVEQVYLWGRPIGEVAVELGVPAGTVKSRLHYAMRTMRRELQGRS